MKSSIILPNYCPDAEVTAHLMKFLETLEKNTDRDSYELIVVENGSFTPQLAEKANFYVYKDHPIGYAKAVNIGLSLAEGDYIVIMNNDLQVPKDWLPRMIEEYESTKGGILAPVDFKTDPDIFYDSHWFSMVMMSRKVFTEIGYLDEQINYRFHDQDYSIRVKKAGYEVMRTGKVTVKHINSATYLKMGRNEDPEEEKLMIKRYGVSHFHDWVKQNG